MPKFVSKLAILAMIEATPGTMVSPTVAHTIEPSDVTLTPWKATKPARALFVPSSAPLKSPGHYLSQDRL